MAAKRPMSSDDLKQIERAMVRIRRRQNRRALAPQEAGVDPSMVGVIDAVEEGSSDGAVTVGMVAERVGVDPSQGSRLVAAAVDAGLVKRAVSQHDGRRSVLELTERGQQVAADVHEMRKQAFSEAMADWSAKDRREFARLLERFVDALDARSG